jgi:hypothetical protein
MSILSSTNSGVKGIKITRELLEERGFVYHWKYLPLPTYTYGTLEISYIFLGDYYTTKFPGLEDFVIESMYDIEMVLRYYKAFQAFDRTEMSKIKIDLGLEKPKEMKIINTDTEIKYVNS